MTPNIFDSIRQQSDYRRWQGRGTLLDALFLRLRNAWVRWTR